MKSKFIIDPQDPSDSFGFFDTARAEVNANFSPPGTSFSLPVTQDVGSPPTSTPVEILSTPALTSEAVQSSSSQSGPTSPVTMTSGGITINLLFDAAAMAAPASFRAGIQQAASLLTAAISDRVTVNIKIDYSGTGGGAAAGADNGQYVSYTTVRSDLINNATPGDTVFNGLPSGSSIQGQANVAVWNAQLKLWGILGANDTTTDDGSATFATDINSNLLVGVALHELTHAMGRVPYGPPYGSQPDILDLFRFTSAGNRLINGASTAPAAYFSVDGGTTKLADYGQNSDPSDFLNSGVQGSNDPFNEFYGGSTIQSLSTVDKEQLDALGFHTAAPLTPTVIESFGVTALVQVGNNFFLDPVAGGTGPELKANGAAVVAGQTGGWTPIGAEQTASGYEVAWKFMGQDQYLVWNTDSAGNWVSSPVSGVTGSSTVLENQESSFHQDLNGDGVIGAPTPPPSPPGTVIESFGVTALVQVGNNFFLDPVAGGTGPELKANGAAVVAGQTGGWTPIGAEQTASGYEVAWKFMGQDQYLVWNTDSAGSWVSSPVSGVTGSSTVLENQESSFHQDLNGDGVIGAPTPPPSPPGTVIESFGVTALVQVGNNFFLDPVAGGTGPELKANGAAVVAGQTGGWTPIGAEQTASGYEVAWKFMGQDQYLVWNTDSAGNWVSSPVSGVTGSSTVLENQESSFHQDLNGDGVIGAPTPPPSPPGTVIESFGVTALVQVGNNFFLDPVAGGTGPELKANGAAVVAGQTGGWTPIGAEQTASGYEVAWKFMGQDQYLVWNTDSAGSWVSSPVSGVTGSSTVLENQESSFHQDLNGDGVISAPTSTHPASTPLADAASATFDGTTLSLDNAATFNGQILGFTGDGTLAGSDQIDLHGFNFNSMHSSFVSWTGVLAVSDGSTTANLHFVGSYSQDNFHFANDGNGGTIVYAAPTLGQPEVAINQVEGSSSASVATITAHDTFVFAPNFGQVNVTNFTPATDTIQFSKTVFATVDAMLAATHDDAKGNAVITDAVHDTITIQHVTTAQLLAHQNDFHFV